MTDLYTALDLARVSGVAWGAAFECPNFETWTLSEPGDLMGDQGLDLMRRLAAHLDKVKPTKVFIEAPLEAHVAARVGHKHETTIRLNGLVFLAMTVCRSRRVPTSYHKRQDVLQHFTGQSRYKETNDGKKACKARVRQIWRAEVSLDEADAGALLHYGCSLAMPRAYLRVRASEPIQHSKR